MNNTIQKLAEKAGIKLPEETAYNGHIYTRSIEKFAELIVRECAEFTHPVTRKFIFEHFGITEKDEF